MTATSGPVSQNISCSSSPETHATSPAASPAPYRGLIAETCARPALSTPAPFVGAIPYLQLHPAFPAHGRWDPAAKSNPIIMPTPGTSQSVPRSTSPRRTRRRPNRSAPPPRPRYTSTRRPGHDGEQRRIPADLVHSANPVVPADLQSSERRPIPVPFRRLHRASADCDVLRCRGLPTDEITPRSFEFSMKNVDLAREEIDRQLKDEREEVDRIVKDAREEMDLKLKIQRSEIDINVLEERMSMDQKLKEERAISDRMLKEERARSDGMLKEERDALDRKLQIERQNMDRIIELERVQMDGIKMMARANMDRKLLEDLKHNQPDPIEPEYEPDVSFDSVPRPDVVMEFKVHSSCLKFPGAFRVLEPDVVDWELIVNQVSMYGYKGKADLYYLRPGFDKINGLSLIEGPAEIDQMMHDHQGTHKCELHILNADSSSDDDSYDGSYE